MIRSLAERALSMAIDASPHRPRRGEARWSLMGSVPAAWRLLGSIPTPDPTAPPTADPAARFVDGHGHTRPVYRYLAAHLHRAATGQETTLPRSTDAVAIEEALWRQCLTVWPRPGSGGADENKADGHRVAEAPARPDAPLHPQGVDDAPDHWTYAELAALHALHLTAQRTGDPALAARVAAACRYHQTHTQPDYTTYQPWALAAFLARPATTPFAEQQLHDTESHLAIAGPAGALLPGLLLADAWWALGA